MLVIASHHVPHDRSPLFSVQFPFSARNIDYNKPFPDLSLSNIAHWDDRPTDIDTD